MDYEKKYNEAPKRVKAVIDVATDRDLVKGVATTIFPELRESEDEMIRKELIMAFEAYDVESSWNGFPVKSILAWLEKQKEQKPQDTVGRVSVEIRSNLQTDEVVRKTLIMLVNDGRISVTGAITSSDILNWLEGQKEPEVDFEIGKYMTTNLLKKRNQSTGIFHLTQKDYATIARHFYELGKNSK